MFSFVLIIMLIYFLITGVTQLVEHEGPFETVQWFMLAFCIIAVPVIIFSGLRALKNYKESKGKRDEEEAKQREELAERKRRFYLDDDEPEYVENTDIDDIEYDADESVEAEVVENRDDIKTED